MNHSTSCRFQSCTDYIPGTSLRMLLKVLQATLILFELQVEHKEIDISFLKEIFLLLQRIMWDELLSITVQAVDSRLCLKRAWGWYLELAYYHWHYGTFRLKIKKLTSPLWKKYFNIKNGCPEIRTKYCLASNLM